ncbi:FAD-binding domain-containing protein [Setomelanomma holmii]|uniref:FAD-binding domain-containing protein n=1 Tax=Setomelanomma holmii TaxID=210430 RepID=A0A9P4GXY0_9PLEO|nr:FAD-binding domain-containing protein [Setomelanomma holmii]
MAPCERDTLLTEKFVSVNEQYLEQDLPIHKRRNQLPYISRTARKVAELSLFAIVLYVCLGVYNTSHARCTPAHGETGAEGQDQLLPLNYTCIPGQACWPSISEWSTFNRSINGNLKLTIPWAAPCYSNSSSEQCQLVAKAYGNGNARTSQYGAMEFLDWETCGQSRCILDSLDPSESMSGECSLGRLSTYHAEVHEPEDIERTLDFIRQHGIRVSIKNTGHDYFGRSNAANSLAIWTHNMKSMKYHQSFQPQGCKTRYENIGEVGAGVQAQEAWTFFEPHGMLVIVGAVGSVGIAGGFGQGGGHGPLGPKYGLMVDQAVEFEVVTADGKFRIINECSDPDLFWAMRGGGGGNYAVLTSYKFQLHTAVPINVYSFQAHFPNPKGELDITKSQAHRDIVTALARNQTLFAENGVAGYNFIHKDGICSLQVLPSSDREAIKTITSQWHSFLSTYPDLIVAENKYYSFDTFSAWHKFTETPAVSRNGPVGLGLMEAGRFIPRSLFESSEDIEQLVEAVLNAMQFSLTNRGGGSAQLYATGPVNHPDNSKTASHPEWRNALWEVIMGAAWTSDTPANIRLQIQNTISESVQPFKALTPGGGCYMNEGDWLEENWQQTFFGDKYDRLLAVKRRYDPTGLFNCWKCVGWTGYDDNGPMYSCYSQSRKSPHPSIPLGPVG